MPGGSGEFDVVRLATLARLTLEPDEQIVYARQLEDILTFAGQVLAVATAGVPPTTHALMPALGEREDVTQPSIDRGVVLGLAPESNTEAGLIRVPRAIDR